MYGVYIFDSEPLEIQKTEQAVDWTEFGFEVIGRGTDYASAEAAIAALKPALVIWGTYKPQSEGAYLIKSLRKAGGGCEIVILTTWWNTDSMGDVFFRGGFDYLLKPLDKVMAEQVLTRFLRKHTGLAT